MVDLLSCAFGGGLFLFFVVAVPPGEGEAAPPFASETAVVEFTFTTNTWPLIVVEPPSTQGDDPARFLVSRGRLRGQVPYRQVAGAFGTVGNGRVAVAGTVPWDHGGGRRLVMLIERPRAGAWCFGVGLATDQSQAREEFGLRVALEGRVGYVQEMNGTRVTFLTNKDGAVNDGDFALSGVGIQPSEDWICADLGGLNVAAREPPHQSGASDAGILDSILVVSLPSIEGTLLSPMTVQDIVGMQVFLVDEPLGIVEYMIQTNGLEHVVINYAGFLGLGETELALPLNGMVYNGENLTSPSLITEPSSIDDFEMVDLNQEVLVRIER